MVSSTVNDQFGNLKNVRGNTEAAKARIRTEGQSQGQMMTLRNSPLLGTQSKQTVGTDFDAHMAVNQSQNQVISQVLEGPVSQQTQRQLAQLQAMSAKNNSLEDLVKSREKPANNENTTNIENTENIENTKNYNTLGRRFGNLQGGSTIKVGVSTGQIFTPSQLVAFRQKNGIFLRAPSSETSSNELNSQKISQSFTLDDQTAITAPTSSAYKPSEPSENNQENPVKTDSIKGDLFSMENIEAIINRVGNALGLDPSLIKAVVKTESNFNHKATSRAGAQGLMQLMPRTAKEMGVEDPFNPLENIWGGARYLKKMLDSNGGNVDRALAAYNWGPGNFERHGSGGNNLPKETRRYIEVVNRNYRKFKNDSATV